MALPLVYNMSSIIRIKYTHTVCSQRCCKSRAAQAVPIQACFRVRSLGAGVSSSGRAGHLLRQRRAAWRAGAPRLRRPRIRGVFPASPAAPASPRPSLTRATRARLPGSSRNTKGFALAAHEVKVVIVIVEVVSRSGPESATSKPDELTKTSRTKAPWIQPKQ